MDREPLQADRQTFQEEYFENQATGVEVEDVGEREQAVKPWNPNKIRISTKPFSLRQVVDMVTDKDIDLAPDFQRLFVWSPVQRSRLIESILLGIPLPAFYFNQDEQGAMQVVDGVQRLTTIYEFVTKGVRIGKDSLEYLKHLEERTYDELDTVSRRRFQQTQIFVNVIEPQTPDEVKFDVFRRINTGGSPLTAQEIRHCLSKQRSRGILKRLIELPSFAEATCQAFARERRMADREVALRFCAFRALSGIEDYQGYDSLDSFLLDFLRRLDGVRARRPALSDAEVETLCNEFDRAMRSAREVFENTAFRKYPPHAERRGPINRALFESWSVALADYEPERLSPYRDVIVQAAREVMAEARYNQAISQGTGDFNKVKLRFSTARDILRQVVP